MSAVDSGRGQANLVLDRAAGPDAAAVRDGRAGAGTDAAVPGGRADAGTGAAGVEVAARPRSVYLDLLRMAAIARVFLHHSLWISWLTVIFPSMSIMFALAGSLTAASLERRGAVRTVRARTRRLIPPLWALAVLAVPLMLLHGWQRDTQSPLHWPDLLWWVLPLANPPASSWGGWFALGLWYLRAYLWLVLLSPVLWWAYRRWPLPTLLTPLALGVLLFWPVPLVILPQDKASDILLSTVTYGTCWLIGFARHRGHLDRVPVAVCALLAAALAGTGLTLAARYGGIAALSANPLADMLWGTGFSLFLMRLRPGLFRLAAMPRISRLISVVNARALTIYIWHLPALFATEALLDPVELRPTTVAGGLATVLLGAVLTGVAVLALGWIEDLAARRRPALLPAGPPVPGVVGPVYLDEAALRSGRAAAGTA